MLDYDELNEIAAYGGFPTRYPHWRFGMEYEQLSKGYRYGLQKIYEMVINNDPCYAYLLRCNQRGRSEAGHGPRLRALRLLQEQHLLQPHQPQDDGRDGQPRQPHPVGTWSGTARTTVEAFIDSCLSLDDLIDIHSPFIKRRDEISRYDFTPDEEERRAAVTRFKSKDYMDEYINPPGVLQASRPGSRRPSGRRPSPSPSSPSTTSCCSSSSTPR